MWELSTPILELVTRAASIYLVLFLLFKVWGKKHLGEMAAFDFVILLIMSEAVQNSLVDDDKSIPGGLIVVATFMILTSIMNIISFKFRKAERFLEGTPKVIVRNGKIMDEVLKKERISLPELLESIREQGVLHLHDVGLAILEANGKVSVIKKEDAKPTGIFVNQKTEVEYLESPHSFKENIKSAFNRAKTQLTK